jgi:hypothetical protein
VTGYEMVEEIDRWCELNEVSGTTFSEMVGERFELMPSSAARRIHIARTTGQMSELWMDRFAVMIDLHDVVLEDSPLIPGLNAYCPKCREVQPSRGDGTCLWCDAQTGGNTIPNVVDRLGDRRKDARSSNAGIPWKCSEEDILEVRRLYLTGLSMYAACGEVHPRTQYANTNAMAMAMYSLFEQRGWNRRKQNEATAARNYKHGLARNPAHRRRLRRAEGYVRGVICKGVKKNAPGAGKPCIKPALKDSEYCRAHDPRYQEQHRQHCLAMRDKREAAAA